MSRGQLSADRQGLTKGGADHDFPEEPSAHQATPRLGKLGRCAAQVLWPAFLGAAMSVGLVFSAIDPMEIDLVGLNLVSSRPAVYTIGFFVFWMLFIVSGTITWFLASADQLGKTAR